MGEKARWGRGRRARPRWCIRWLIHRRSLGPCDRLTTTSITAWQEVERRISRSEFGRRLMISNLWLNLLRLCNTLVGRRAREGAPSLLILMKCCIAMHLTLRVDHHRRQLEWFAHYLKGEPAADWTTHGGCIVKQESQVYWRGQVLPFERRGKHIDVHAGCKAPLDERRGATPSEWP